MDNSTKKEQLLAELNRITGLRLSFSDTDGMPDEEQAVKGLSVLLDAYRRSGTREDAVLRWTTGAVGEDDFRILATRFHIDPDTPLVLYYVELDKTEGNTDQAVRLLKQVLADRRGLMALRLHDAALLILEPVKKRLSAEIKADDTDPVLRTAESILSVINTELFVNARVMCSGILPGVYSLPAAYADALYAMSVERIFHPDRRIGLSDCIGEDRLLYEHSPEVLRAYLKETLGGAFSQADGTIAEAAARVFEGDYLLAANCFLDNDLNIAETARILHFHRNTLIYRIEQIRAETGLDIRRFDDAMRYRLCSLAICALRSK